MTKQNGIPDLAAHFSSLFAFKAVAFLLTISSILIIPVVDRVVLTYIPKISQEKKGCAVRENKIFSLVLPLTFALLFSYCRLKYSSVAGGDEQAQAGTVSTFMQSFLCETNTQCNGNLRAEYSIF